MFSDNSLIKTFVLPSCPSREHFHFTLKTAAHEAQDFHRHRLPPGLLTLFPCLIFPHLAYSQHQRHGWVPYLRNLPYVWLDERLKVPKKEFQSCHPCTASRTPSAQL